MSTALPLTQDVPSQAQQWIPAEPPPTAPQRRPDMIRLLLGGTKLFNEELQDPTRLATRLTQSLGIALVGFGLHGAITGVVAQLLAPDLHLIPLAGHPMLWLPIALTVSLIGALGLCLPVFFFCTQMAGLDVSPAMVAVQALRANATRAVVLFGLLPVMVALALGALALQTGADAVVAVGLALPIVIGLGGIRSVYQGFVDLADRQQLSKERRPLMLGMILAATVIYGLIAPVALYRLCDVLGHHL
jgi:hypothetical protein